MYNAPASCSARAPPEHHPRPRGVATQHAVARQSGVALRHQPDVCHGGYVDLEDALDGRDDLGPAFELDSSHVGVPDHADGVFRWGIATWYEPKGMSYRRREFGVAFISSRVVEGNPGKSFAWESPTRAMSTWWVSSACAVRKSYAVNIS